MSPWWCWRQEAFHRGVGGVGFSPALSVAAKASLCPLLAYIFLRSLIRPSLTMSLNLNYLPGILTPNAVTLGVRLKYFQSVCISEGAKTGSGPVQPGSEAFAAQLPHLTPMCLVFSPSPCLFISEAPQFHRQSRAHPQPLLSALCPLASQDARPAASPQRPPELGLYRQESQGACHSRLPSKPRRLRTWCYLLPITRSEGALWASVVPSCQEPSLPQPLPSSHFIQVSSQTSP